MIAMIATGLMVAMLVLMIHELFDFRDPQPFGIEPELPIFMLGSMLLLCVGTLVLGVRLLSFSLALFEWLPQLLAMYSKTIERSQAFEVERLLFSPPLAVLSLRI